MQISLKEAELLKLSSNERVVLEALSSAFTPLAISGRTKIPRATVYVTLSSLKARGLAHSRILKGRRRWERSNDDETGKLLDEAKRALIPKAEERIRVSPSLERPFTVHIGGKAIATLIRTTLEKHANGRITALQGTEVAESYDKIFGRNGVDELNRLIKKNRIIIDAILPTNFFSTMIARWGIEWAKEFEGRSTAVRTIDPSYFDHATDLMIFRDTVVFIAHKEETAYEIKSPELVRLITSLLMFIKDHGAMLDANEELRKLIEQKKGKSFIR